MLSYYLNQNLSSQDHKESITEGNVFLPEASFGLWVLSLPAYVCVYVWVSVCLFVCQSLVCLFDKWRHVQPRITKLGPKMQKTLGKVHIVLWADQP